MLTKGLQNEFQNKLKHDSSDFMRLVARAMKNEIINIYKKDTFFPNKRESHHEQKYFNIIANHVLKCDENELHLSNQSIKEFLTVNGESVLKGIQKDLEKENIVIEEEQDKQVRSVLSSDDTTKDSPGGCW